MREFLNDGERIGDFARVIRTRPTVGRWATCAKQHQRGVPSAFVRFAHQAAHIVRVYAALESVQHEQSGRSVVRGYNFVTRVITRVDIRYVIMGQFDKITIGHFNRFPTHGQFGLVAPEFSPQCCGVRAGQPPGRSKRVHDNSLRSARFAESELAG